jgi:hypothetical protein
LAIFGFFLLLRIPSCGTNSNKFPREICSHGIVSVRAANALAAAQRDGRTLPKGRTLAGAKCGVSSHERPQNALDRPSTFVPFTPIT